MYKLQIWFVMLMLESLQAGSTNLTNVNQATTEASEVPNEPEIDYNVTAYENYIYNAFLFPVNKAEALAYLDKGGPLPQRYAKVIAVRGGNDPPDVMEYRVRVGNYKAFLYNLKPTQL